LLTLEGYCKLEKYKYDESIEIFNAVKAMDEDAITYQLNDYISGIKIIKDFIREISYTHSIEEGQCKNEKSFIERLQKTYSINM
jgi:hypothetical protein